jgi:predicted dehydrogenase
VNENTNTTASTVADAAEPFKVVVVGTGRQGTEHRIPSLRSIPGVAITGVVDVAVERAQAVADSYNDADKLDEFRAVGYDVRDGLQPPRAYASLTEALSAEQPDAVVVVVPHAFHKAVTLEALSGLVAPPAHVLVEKPMATSLQDAVEMEQAAARARRVLAVGYQNAHAVRWAAEQLHAGAIGELRGLTLHWTRESGIPGAEHFWASREDGGVTPDLAGHLAAPLQVLLGADNRVVRLSARGSGEAGRAQYGAGFVADDTVVARLELANGATGKLVVSWATGLAPDEQAGVTLFGSEGKLEVPFIPQKGIGYVPSAGDFLPVLRRWDAGTQLGPDPLIYTELVVDQAYNWIAAMHGREELVLPTAAAVAVERVVDGIRRSADADGAAIDLG